MRQSGHDSVWAWFRAPRDKWDAPGISPVLQAPNQRSVILTYINLTCLSHALGCPSWNLAVMPRHLNPTPISNYFSNKSLHVNQNRYGVHLHFIPLVNIEGGPPYKIRVFWGAIFPRKTVLGNFVLPIYPSNLCMVEGFSANAFSTAYLQSLHYYPLHSENKRKGRPWKLLC